MTALLPWWDAIAFSATVIGAFMFLSGFILFAKDQGPKGHGLFLIDQWAAIGSIITGLVLINSMPMLDMLGQTLFARSSEDMKTMKKMLDVANKAPDPFAIFLPFASTCLQIAGLVWFITACWRLKTSATDSSVSWFNSFWQLVGSVALINHITVFQIIGKTSGGTVEQWVNKIITSAY